MSRELEFYEKGLEQSKEFLNYFFNKTKTGELTDLEDTFADAFAEFIRCLYEVDLSDKTLEYLYEIFIKDMEIFFINVKKER